VVVAPESTPQSGEQAVVVPLVTRVQVTPGVAVPSFVTVALRVTAAPPGAMVEIAFVIVTETVLGLLLPPPHPTNSRTTNAPSMYTNLELADPISSPLD
jgi:hypothetical protein